jgi:outer membrane lipoprotein-sorting protein
MVTRFVVLCCALSVMGDVGQSAPSGRDVIEQMRSAYAGKWFRTLTFVQKTTLVLADGTRTEQTWYESMRSPSTLRIDVAPLSDGNGSLNLADKVIVVRGGRVSQTRPDGNPFLPFVAGIYTQPLDDTIAQLAPQGYDLTKTHVTDVQGRRTIVVGTATRDDLSAPQFWVDAERLVVVRALVRSGAAGSPLLDVALEGYVKSGQSWVAARVTMSSGGAVRQIEEYTDIKTDVDLPDDLFDPSKWTTAPHWAGR